MRRRRGTLSKINSELNRPTTKFGIDYRLIGLCFGLSILVFLFRAHILACLLLPSLLSCGHLLTRKDPKMLRLWLLSFRQSAYYDPGKLARREPNA